MGAIPTATFLAIMDSIAAQKRKNDQGMSESSPALANTVAFGAQANVDRIEALSDEDAKAQLLSAAIVNRDQAFSDKASPGQMAPLIRALNANVGGIDTYASANNIRIAPQAKKVVEAILFPLSATTTFSPEVDPMATFSVTAPGAGTFTDGGAIDKTKYAPQQLTLYVSGGPTGAAAATYTITLKKGSNANETRTVNVPGATPVNTEFSIGAASDKYDDVIAISVSGGNAGDQVKVKAKVERVIDDTDL